MDICSGKALGLSRELSYRIIPVKKYIHRLQQNNNNQCIMVNKFTTWQINDETYWLTNYNAHIFVVKYYVKLNKEMSNNIESTKLENSSYNVLSALGREADFLYSTVDKYIEDAEKDGRQNLVDLWKEIKRDKQRHLSRLRECLEQEAKDNKLTS